MNHWPAHALGTLFAVTGTLHFSAPNGFDAVVPAWLGPPRPWVYASGLAELVVALLLWRRSPALGGKLAFILLLAVWPANFSAALTGGYVSAPAPLNGTGFAWIRVLLQLPLLWWAYRVGWAPRKVIRS